MLVLTPRCSQQPPPPSLPEEETDEEKGLRRLFELLAGDVRNTEASHRLPSVTLLVFFKGPIFCEIDFTEFYSVFF